MKSKFPCAEMISAGEVKRAIAQTPNYTARENGRPMTFGEMATQGPPAEQTVHGLEEIDYESPMFRGLRMDALPRSLLPFGGDYSTSSSVADDDYATLPSKPMPNKVAW